MKFCGKFKGCCRETLICFKGVSETEYPAIIKIKNVNCSQKTAYLIEVKDETGEYNNLAFVEKDDKPILRSVTQDGNGITSTYYEDKYLIHQVSFVKENCKGEKQWFVKYYKMKQC